MTNLRVERLQDITEEGAVREGLYKGWKPIGVKAQLLTARQAFKVVWRMVTRKAPAWQTWYCNPWVWVVEFERCEKPEADT